MITWLRWLMNRLQAIFRAFYSSSSSQARLPLSPAMSRLSLNFDNVNLEHLPVDPEKENFVRKVTALFSLVEPTPVENPRLVIASASALSLLDLDHSSVLSDPHAAKLFSGNELFPGSQPFSHCYCGHQFGSFAGQLGDGRAISLGEVVNKSGGRWELQLKGAGKTPFSRFADGRAVLRSSIREFLCSEHMFALGVPTTRAGTLVVSDTMAIRDPNYSGRQILEPCAIVSRIAPTLIRFGSWEVFKRMDGDREGPLVDQPELASRMLDHVIKYHFPQIHQSEDSQEAKYLKFFEDVVIKTAKMVADWQLVGFTHGVMNTDNMSILGLTIDYGPFGFLDRYNPNFTPNTTDENGRYRFEAQPGVCKWNLVRFAEALSVACPLASLREVINTHYDKEFQRHYLEKLGQKLGMVLKREDMGLITGFFNALQQTSADFTNTFRCLSRVSYDPNDPEHFPTEVLEYLVSQSGTIEDAIRVLSPPFNRAQIDSLKILKVNNPQTFMMLSGGQENVIEVAEKALAQADALRAMQPEEMTQANRTVWQEWLKTYTARVAREAKESGEEPTAFMAKRAASMNQSNPKYILRNYLLQNAIKKAEAGDFTEVERLYKVMTSPFSEHDGNEDLGADGKIPEWACNYVLSCSS